ncbi:MAG: tRNA (guanosine(37)-N1)-methyltransferase TrmD, partial [Candidatus Kerfeldbacteria bacterium CG15_BIG_FIL_POST_REV_8_21_14_020_45_12]
MQFDIVTIFPELFDSIFGTSILKRAIEDGKIVVNFHDPRNFS